jgi:gliding motility-associated-like protein
LDSTICQNELPLIWNGLTFNSAGTQTLNLTCINDCDSTVIMNVQVFPLPQISISGGATYCEGDVIQPIILNIVGTAPYNVSYTLEGIGTNVSSNQTQINLGNSIGTYILTEVSDQNCNQIANFGTASIIVNSTPNIPGLNSDTSYCFNFIPDTLEATGDANAQFYWYNQSDLQNVIETGTYYLPENILGTTTYYVIQEVDGCLSPPSEVNITFNYCNVIIPTAFTPDGDNVNDTWILDGIDAIFPNNIISIYNRWGNLLFQSEKGKYETNPWDGKFNNEPMPVGTYYFIIEYNDKLRSNESGIVSIILD